LDTFEMSAPRHLEHVTLDTGHTRRSPRSEAADEVVRGLAAGLDRAIATKAREPVPGFALFSYNVAALGGAAIFTLWREAAPVVTFGVAANAKDSAKIWRLLHQGGAGKHATNPERPPAAPWIGARMEAGAASTPHDDLLWIAKFERSLAWAFIERRARAQ
jgi:predicted outer membrane repeat protein